MLVVDDHPLVRDSLCRVLENSGEFEVVGQASDGEKAVSLAERLRPDAVIMDLIMPGMDGVAACRGILELLPDARVLMLTASTDDEAVIAAVAAGATGFVHQGRQFAGPSGGGEGRGIGPAPDSASCPQAGLRRGLRSARAGARGKVSCAHRAGAGGADAVCRREFLC